MCPRTKRRGRFGLVTTVLVTTVIMVSILARIDNWRRDWTTNFATLEEQADDPALRPLSLNLTPPEVAVRLKTWAENQRRWKFVRSDVSDQGGEIGLTRSTTLMRFTDDVTVRLRATDEGTRVDAESRSRIGIGDLGQNPRNLKELTAAF